MLAPLALTTGARADEALVAVAANFAGAAQAIAEQFSLDTGHSVVLTTGSTGKLFAQSTQGAPFAMLLSADMATPERLEAEGAAVPGSRFTYAVGRLALYSGDDGRDLGDLAAALSNPDARFVAIANPALAPYGIAAREALQSMGLWDRVQDRIVMGQNVGQTFSLVQSGAAQVGFVALSAVLENGSGAWQEVPQEMFTPIRQQAVLLSAGADNAAAAAFAAYLRGPAATAIITAHGYGIEAP